VERELAFCPLSPAGERVRVRGFFVISTPDVSSALKIVHLVTSLELPSE
jgi:hypothetical protein